VETDIVTITDIFDNGSFQICDVNEYETFLFLAITIHGPTDRMPSKNAPVVLTFLQQHNETGSYTSFVSYISKFDKNYRQFKMQDAFDVLNKALSKFYNSNIWLQTKLLFSSKEEYILNSTSPHPQNYKCFSTKKYKNYADSSGYTYDW
jgi:FPC/CPF motif-containing protein YcgG